MFLFFSIFSFFFFNDMSLENNIVYSYMKKDILIIYTSIVMPFFIVMFVNFILYDEFSCGTFKIPVYYNFSREIIIFFKYVITIIFIFILCVFSYLSCNICAVLKSIDIIHSYKETFHIYLKLVLSLSVLSSMSIFGGIIIDNKNVLLILLIGIYIFLYIANIIIPDIGRYGPLYNLVNFSIDYNNNNIVFLYSEILLFFSLSLLTIRKKVLF